MARFFDIKTSRYFDLGMYEDDMPDYSTDFACNDSRTHWVDSCECYAVPDGEYLIDEAIDWQLRQGDFSMDPEDPERLAIYCWLDKGGVMHGDLHRFHL